MVCVESPFASPWAFKLEERLSDGSRIDEPDDVECGIV